MDRFHLRPYSPFDAQAVVEVINAASLQTVGFPRAVVDAVGNIRHQRYVPPSSAKVVAVNDHNEIVGYAFHTDRENAIVTETGGAVHPAYWEKGVGRALVT